MHCENVRAALFAYADGMLDAQQRDAIATHLGQCADCSGHLADLQAFARQAAQWQPLSAPPQQRPGPSRGHWWPLAAAAALAAAVLFETRVEVGDGSIAVSFGQGASAARLARLEQSQEQLQTTLASSTGVGDRQQIIADLIDITREVRRDELRAVAAALVVELEQQRAATDETMGYLVAHQAQDQQELQRLAMALNGAQAPRGDQL